MEEGLKYTYFWHKMLPDGWCCWLQWSSHLLSPNNGFPRGRQRLGFHSLRHVSSGGGWGKWSLFFAWLWLLRIKVHSKLVVCPKLTYWTWKGIAKKERRWENAGGISAFIEWYTNHMQICIFFFKSQTWGPVIIR